MVPPGGNTKILARCTITPDPGCQSLKSMPCSISVMVSKSPGMAKRSTQSPSSESVAQPPAHEGQKPQDESGRLDHDLGVLVLGEEHRRVEKRRWILGGKALYPAGCRQAVEGPRKFLEPRGGPVPVHGRDVLVVLVLDGVRRSFGDGERFAGAKLVPSTLQEHVRRAGHHPVGFLLPRMDMNRRTTAVGPHGALYLDELTSGIGGGLRDDELQADLGRELEHVLRWDRLDAYPFVASSRRPTGRGFAFVEHGPSLLSLAYLQSL